MPDVDLLRYVRMCTLWHVTGHLWRRCVSGTRCVRHPSRQTKTMQHFCRFVEGMGRSFSRTGRFKDPRAPLFALVRVMFVDWDPDVCSPPLDIGQSLPGRTALMVMAWDRLQQLWYSMPKHSKAPLMVEFGDYVARVQRCFREDGRALEHPAALDAVLARHYDLVVAVAAR